MQINFGVRAYVSAVLLWAEAMILERWIVCSQTLVSPDYFEENIHEICEYLVR